MGWEHNKVPISSVVLETGDAPALQLFLLGHTLTPTVARGSSRLLKHAAAEAAESVASYNEVKWRGRRGIGTRERTVRVCPNVLKRVRWGI